MKNYVRFLLKTKYRPLHTMLAVSRCWCSVPSQALERQESYISTRSLKVHRCTTVDDRFKTVLLILWAVVSVGLDTQQHLWWFRLQPLRIAPSGSHRCPDNWAGTQIWAVANRQREKWSTTPLRLATQSKLRTNNHDIISSNNNKKKCRSGKGNGGMRQYPIADYQGR